VRRRARLAGREARRALRWLWDFDARPLSAADESEPAGEQIGRTGFKGVKLRKTSAFLEAHPFGTVPAAFSPDGTIGIFESNSIMRAVARLGGRGFPLYGQDPYEASRVDSFLDASLVFARDAQTYLLSLLDGSVSARFNREQDALATYLGGIGRALLPERYFWSARITRRHLLVAELLFGTSGTEDVLERRASRRSSTGEEDANARAFAHFDRLRMHPAFAPTSSRISKDRPAARRDAHAYDTDVVSSSTYRPHHSTAPSQNTMSPHAAGRLDLTTAEAH
jgi:glutathione S-transferase